MGRGRNGAGRAGMIVAGKVTPGQAGTQKPLSAAVNKVLNSDDLQFVRKLSDRQVGEWLANEPGYNEFTPRRARAFVNAVKDAYPEAVFYVGREYSRVVYVDTGVPYRGSYTGRTAEDVRREVDTTVNNIKRRMRADEASTGTGVSMSNNGSHLNALYRSETGNVFARFWWD